MHNRSKKMPILTYLPKNGFNSGETKRRRAFQLLIFPSPKWRNSQEYSTSMSYNAEQTKQPGINKETTDMTGWLVRMTFLSNAYVRNNRTCCVLIAGEAIMRHIHSAQLFAFTSLFPFWARYFILPTVCMSYGYFYLWLERLFVGY